MVIDPAVVEPAIESYNRIATIAPFPVTYHLPALYGTSSLGMYNDNVRGIIVMGSAASVNDNHKWQHERSSKACHESTGLVDIIFLKKFSSRKDCLETVISNSQQNNYVNH